MPFRFSGIILYKITSYDFSSASEDFSRRPYRLEKYTEFLLPVRRFRLAPSDGIVDSSGKDKEKA